MGQAALWRSKCPELEKAVRACSVCGIASTRVCGRSPRSDALALLQADLPHSVAFTSIATCFWLIYGVTKRSAKYCADYRQLISEYFFPRKTFSRASNTQRFKRS